MVFKKKWEYRVIVKNFVVFDHVLYCKTVSLQRSKCLIG